MSGKAADDEFDPRVDLLDRYEGMTKTQVERIGQIDRKAVSTARIVSVIGGVILTGVSVAGGQSVTVESVPSGVAITIGVLGLFASLCFSVITYLSSKFAYGPGPEFGRVMSEQNVTDTNYQKVLLSGYAQAIANNKKVVEKNSGRFRYSLTSLLIALVFIFTAVLIRVLGIRSGVLSWLSLIVACVLAGVTAWFVLEKSI